MLRILKRRYLSAALIMLSVCILSLAFHSARAEERTTADVPQTGFDMDSIHEFKEKGEAYKKDMKVPANRYSDEGKREAEKMSGHFHSSEFQERLQSETERVKETLLKDYLEQHNADSNTDNLNKSSLLPTERIYIFISSSLPIETLRRYTMDLDKLSDPHISIVLRGFVGGMKHITPTLEFVSKVLVKDEACTMAKEKCDIFRVNLEIDPLLFRRYRITQVPAVVYVPEININDPDISEAEDKDADATDYYVAYGDASLEYILDLIHSDTGSRSVEGALTVLRKGFY